MEIREINTFLKVAVLQNFSKAAQQLGYSQSAVTVQMQHLEKELNVQLFERIGKRVYLTEKGREFVPFANDIIHASQAALKFSAQDEPRGTLRIGGVESTCTALLPDLLPEFYRRCPQVEVVIRSGTTGDLIELMENNQLDLVLTLDRKLYKPSLICCAERAEPIVFTAPRRGGCGPCCRLSLERLCRLPFLLTENGAAYRYELERLLALREMEIRPILEIGNTETIINLLKKGIGASFLPRFTVEKELRTENFTLIETDLPQVSMLHQLLYCRGKWMTRQMEIFTELVSEAFAR